MSSATIQLPAEAALNQCLLNNSSLRHHQPFVPNMNRLIADIAHCFAEKKLYPHTLHWHVIFLLQQHSSTQSLPAGFRQEVSYDLFRGICACETLQVNDSLKPRSELTELFEKSLRHFWSE